MSEQDKELSRRFTALFNTDDPAALAAVIGEITTADVELHAGSAGEVRGQRQFQQVIEAWRVAFPDARSTVEEQIAEGDRVVTRWTARGTHTGDFQGMPPPASRSRSPGSPSNGSWTPRSPRCGSTATTSACSASSAPYPRQRRHREFRATAAQPTDPRWPPI
jgi:predicted ester cyclase